MVKFVIKFSLFMYLLASPSWSSGDRAPIYFPGLYLLRYPESQVLNFDITSGNGFLSNRISFYLTPDRNRVTGSRQFNFFRIGGQIPIPLPNDYNAAGGSYYLRFYVNTPHGANGMSLTVPGAALNHQSYLSINSSIYNQALYRTTVYHQTDRRWAKHPYGDSSGRTIGQIGCCLTCAASMVTDILSDVGSALVFDPPSLNDSLVRNKGFVNRVLVDHNAVCAIVNENFRYWNRPYRLAHTRGMSVDEALFRDYKVMCTVSRGGHFVRPYAFVSDTRSAVRRAIMDPANRHQNLEDYQGYSTTNTRVYYLRSATPHEMRRVRTSGIIIHENGENNEYDHSCFPGLSYGNSAILASCEDIRISLKLIGGGRVEESEIRKIEDESGDEILVASVVEVCDAPPSTYNLVARGPDGIYDIEIRKYDFESNVVIENVKLNIVNGVGSMMVVHNTRVLFCNDLSGLPNIPDGAEIEICNIKVTVCSDSDFYAQGVYPVPAIRVLGQATPGSIISWAVGNIYRDPHGIITLSPSWIKLKPSDDSVNPVVTRPDHIFQNKPAYIKTYGRVTAILPDYYVLGNIKIYRRSAYPPSPGIITVGSWLEVDGVFTGDHILPKYIKSYPQ